jgi:hypothetical protein
MRLKKLSGAFSGLARPEPASEVVRLLTGELEAS